MQLVSNAGMVYKLSNRNYKDFLRKVSKGMDVPATLHEFMATGRAKYIGDVINVTNLTATTALAMVRGE
jgi:hypothetical protein